MSFIHEDENKHNIIEFKEETYDKKDLLITPSKNNNIFNVLDDFMNNFNILDINTNSKIIINSCDKNEYNLDIEMLFCNAINLKKNINEWNFSSNDDEKMYIINY